MKQLLAPALLATVLAASATAQVTDPNTGHTYQVINTALNWTDADAEAKTQMFNNQPGRLATINDQAELDFLLNNLNITRPWLGGFQDHNDAGYVEPAGGWVWITGEPFSFTNWNPGEPNDTAANGGPEDYLEMFANGEWNDTNLAGTPWITSYVVEWEPSGPIGTNYCGPAALNSSGQSGEIAAFGSITAGDNDVRLDATQLAVNKNSYFITSMTQGFVQPPGSQGFLCLGGTIGRYNQSVLFTGAAGEVSLQLDLTNTPVAGGVAIQPGETWNWQLWFRDNNPNPTSNFTDAVSITFN